MTFFKYRVLNSLRDELGLTMTRQKVTLFHFLGLLIPTSGLVAGIAWGRQGHNPPNMIVAGMIGALLGLGLAWVLPRLLWNVLRLFAGRRWFLQPDHPGDTPIMTGDEFLVRSGKWAKERNRHFWLSTSFFIAGLLAFERVFHFIDKTGPTTWIQILAGIGLLIFIPAYVFLCRRWTMRLVRKCGLDCPHCGSEITDAAGLSRVPSRGICRHCGTKVIDI